MIVKQKQTLELPIVGQQYVGKHGEKVFVTNISASAYINNELTVSYQLLGPKFYSQSMKLERFMDWASDGPYEKPKLGREYNPFACARKTDCIKGKDGCSHTGWIVDGKFFCDEHHVFAEKA